MTPPLWLLLLMAGSGSAPVGSTTYGNKPSRNALRNVVSIYRLTVPNPDVDGGQQNVWVPVALNVQCSVQPRRAERMDTQGAIRQITEYGITFASNPGAFVLDQIQWVDDLGITRFISIRGTNNLAGRGGAFYSYGDEDL